MSRPHIPLVLVLVLGWGVTPPTAGADDGPSRERLARVNYLIGMLASKNPAPTFRGDGRFVDRSIRLSAEYDKSLQVPVYLAMQQLLLEGEVALDRLFAHPDDERYSFSVNSYEDRNVSVSGACSTVAEHILFPFNSELRVISRDQYGIYPELEATGGSVAAWWQKNRKRGLVKVQIEAIDETIRFMEKADRDKVLPVHADAPPLPAEEFERDRAENLRTLRRIRNQIIETREPYQSKRMFDETEDIHGLPWTRRKHNL